MTACHVGRHRHDIGTDHAVARPRRPHVRIPHCSTKNEGDPNRGERNQQRQNSNAALFCLASHGLRGLEDMNIGTFAALQLQFSIRHGNLSVL